MQKTNCFPLEKFVNYNVNERRSFERLKRQFRLSSHQCRSERQFHDNPYKSGVVVYLSFPCERQASLECLVV